MARLKIARRTRLTVAGLVLALAAVAAAWICWPRERLLMDRARRVTSARGWSVDRGPDACICYAWLSDHEVLYCKGSTVDAVTLYRRDVVTGQESALTTLTNLFHKTHADVDGVTVSPDGRFVHWVGGADSTVCASLDGSRCMRYPWPGNCYSECFWIGTTGARWLELTNARAKTDGPGPLIRLALHDEAGPGSSAALALPTKAATGDGRPGAIAIDGIDGIALLAPNWKPVSSHQPTTAAAITQTFLSSAQHPQRVFPQSLPRDCFVHRMCLSPDGRRVAWLADVQTPAPLAQLLHRLVPAIPAPAPKSLQMWVSRVESGKVEEIGRLRTSGPHPDSRDLLDFHTLQWLPDGKKVSFVYGENLYAVDAP